MRELAINIEGLVPDVVAINLKEDLTVTEDLEREVAEGSAMYGYYAVLSEKAEARSQSVELAFKVWKNAKERKLIKEHGNFKLAKDMERMVICDPTWKAYQIKIGEYQSEAKILKQISKAFELKVSLVQTANANRRAEFERGRGK